MTISERDAAIVAAYEGGTPQPSLAKQYGVSQPRISQIIKKHRASAGPRDGQVAGSPTAAFPPCGPECGPDSTALSLPAEAAEHGGAFSGE